MLKPDAPAGNLKLPPCNGAEIPAAGCNLKKFVRNRRLGTYRFQTWIIPCQTPTL